MPGRRVSVVCSITHAPAQAIRAPDAKPEPSGRHPSGTRGQGSPAEHVGPTAEPIMTASGLDDETHHSPPAGRAPVRPDSDRGEHRTRAPASTRPTGLTVRRTRAATRAGRTDGPSKSEPPANGTYLDQQPELATTHRPPTSAQHPPQHPNRPSPLDSHRVPTDRQTTGRYRHKAHPNANPSARLISYLR